MAYVIIQDIKTGKKIQKLPVGDFMRYCKQGRVAPESCWLPDVIDLYNKYQEKEHARCGGGGQKAVLSLT